MLTSTIEAFCMKVKGTAITVALLVLCTAATTENKRSHVPEQLHFSAEDNGVKKPVVIPNSVLDILTSDEDVRDELESEKIAAEGVPLWWFSASAIHLSSPERLDLVVMGEWPLSGANVTTFWVFRMTDRGYDLVLRAPAHDLIVNDTRWKGYRDIELISMTAKQMSTVVCRFNGQRYEAHRKKTETH